MGNLFSNLKRIKPQGFKIFNLLKSSKVIINLGVGEPDFKTPDHIIKATKIALEEGLTSYTPSTGLSELRVAISEKVLRENKIRCSRDDVCVTVGGTQGLFAALSALDVREVLLPTPAFSAFRPTILLSGGTVKEVPLSKEDGFKLKTEDLEKEITKKSNILILNSPNNPTGAIYGRGELEEIADFIIEHDLWVISDEVYEKFIYEGRHLSIGALNGMEERIITLNSFSKTYGMTGWRVGYVIAWEELIERISRFSLYTIVCPPSFVQRGAISAFKGSQDFFHKVLREYKRRRDLIFKRLKEIDGASLSKPKGTFYCFPDISETGLSSEEFFSLLFKKAKVGCVPGSIYGKAGEGKVRFSFAVSTEKIKEAFERIKRVL